MRLLGRRKNRNVINVIMSKVPRTTTYYIVEFGASQGQSQEWISNLRDQNSELNGNR